MDNNTTFERQAKDKKAFLEAMKEMPIIQVACKRVGISRATYYRWRKEDKSFLRESEDSMAQGFEFVNDMSESQIINLIKEKKLPAITLWLKHHHPRYGSKVMVYAPITPIEDLSSEEQRLIIDALSLASGGTLSKNQND